MTAPYKSKYLDISNYEKNIPDEMKKTPQWLLWKLEGTDKVPCSVHSGYASHPGNPASWGTFSEAIEAFRINESIHGIGFALAGTEFCCIDLDNVLKPGGGLIYPTTDEFSTVRDVLERVTDTYCEVSQSGKGLHYFIKARQPKEEQKTEDGVEIYAGLTADGGPTYLRFMAMTGNAMDGSRPKLANCQDFIDRIYQIAVKDKATDERADSFEPAIKGQWASAPGPALTDSDIRNRLLTEKEYGPKYQAILSNEWQNIPEFNNDASRARQSLANKLAFYCGSPKGRDFEQMKRLLLEAGPWGEYTDRERRAERDCKTALKDLKGVYDPQNVYKNGPQSVQPKQPVQPANDFNEPFTPVDTVIIDPFPVNIFPPLLKEFAIQKARELEVPIDFVGNGIMAIASGCLTQRAEVTGLNGHVQPLNRFTIIASDAGTNKTGTFKVLAQPIIDYENAQNVQLKPQIEKRKLERKAVSKEISVLNKVIESDLRKLKSDELDADKISVINKRLEKNQTELEELEKKLAPGGPLEELRPYSFYMGEDATPEGIVRQLYENKAKAFIIDSEGRKLFNILSGLYSATHQTDVDAVNSMYDGQTIKTTRGNADKNFTIPRASGGMMLYLQPDVMEKAFKNPEFVKSGFMGRTFLIYPQELVRLSANPPRADEAVCVHYKSVMWALLSLLEDPEGIFFHLKLEMSPEAMETWQKYYLGLQDRYRTPDHSGDLEHMQDWMNKVRGKVLRDSAIIHVLHATDKKLQDDPNCIAYGNVLSSFDIRDTIITRQEMKSAIQLMDYSIKHAMLLYGTETSSELDGLSYVWGLIQKICEKNKSNCFTLRELRQRIKRNDLRGIKNSERVIYYLDTLEHNNFIRTIEQDSRKAGRHTIAGPYLVNGQAIGYKIDGIKAELKNEKTGN